LSPDFGAPVSTIKSPSPPDNTTTFVPASMTETLSVTFFTPAAALGC
jgi:hypothetical protein